MLNDSDGMQVFFEGPRALGLKKPRAGSCGHEDDGVVRYLARHG
jgi:hypothetical protein